MNDEAKHTSPTGWLQRITLYFGDLDDKQQQFPPLPTYASETELSIP